MREENSVPEQSWARKMPDQEQPELQHQTAHAKEILRGANRIAVFTGAGVSAESGIATFRDADGLWSRFPPEQFARWSSLEELLWRNPSRVAEFIVELIGPVLAAQPNPAHMAIAELEHLGKRVDVITQNIDGLHQRAGSSSVIELHGSVFQLRQQQSAGARISEISPGQLASLVRELENLLDSPGATPIDFLEAAAKLFGITAEGAYRPNLVLFGDLLPEPEWEKAVAAVNDCDCLVVAGTSQLVYPAAHLPDYARKRGAKVIATGFDPCPCDVWLYGAAGIVLPMLISSLQGQRG